LVSYFVGWLVSQLFSWSVDQSPYTGSNVAKRGDRIWDESEPWRVNSVLHPDICL